jgi:hypothetical protein
MRLPLSLLERGYGVYIRTLEHSFKSFVFSVLGRLSNEEEINYIFTLNVRVACRLSRNRNRAESKNEKFSSLTLETQTDSPDWINRYHAIFLQELVSLLATAEPHSQSSCL